MTCDEAVRALCYFVMFPAYFYFGMIAHNRREYTVALFYYSLSCFFALMLFGLSLGAYRYQFQTFLYLNTGVIVIMTTAVLARSAAILYRYATRGIDTFTILERD
jgi:hypothetical protein